MFGKSLAHIEKIKELQPIEGADKIVLATVLDWNVIVKKDEFKVGDKCVYIEIDSIVPSPEPIHDETTGEVTGFGKPEYEHFAFLEKRHWKIKSMKMRGVISQGIVFKLSDLKLEDLPVGTDVTERLGITEIVEDEEEAGLNTSPNKWFLDKWLMRFAWYRNFKKSHRVSGSWRTEWPSKSDEENVQKIWSKMNTLYPNDTWVKTEKIEGQNMTVVVSTKKGWFGRSKKKFEVLSRTRNLVGSDLTGPFWSTFRRLKLDKKLENLSDDVTWFIRGEHVGPGIQKNIYQLKETDFAVFDVYKLYKDGSKVKYSWDAMTAFCEEHCLRTVPLIEKYTGPLPDVQTLLKETDKHDTVFAPVKHKREGIVWRLEKDYNVSFKVKNPEYSL